MKIAIGSDHRGFLYKQEIIDALKKHQWIDVGAHENTKSDFPLYAQKVVQKIQQKSVECGVLLCATGIGMSIAANRFPHIYAGLAWNAEVAKLAKQHDNANILVIPSDFVSLEMAIEMVYAWTQAQFLGGRYQERIDIIDAFL